MFRMTLCLVTGGMECLKNDYEQETLSDDLQTEMQWEHGVILIEKYKCDTDCEN